MRPCRLNVVRHGESSENRIVRKTRSMILTLHETLEHLFSPLALGPALLQNRIVSTAHQTTLVHEHLPTADFVAYHEARARGGAGLIVLEATAVHPSGLLTAHT